MRTGARWVAALAFVLLAALAGGCASTDKDGPPPLPTEVEGNDGVSTRRLEFAARREMASYEENGRRPADLADAAYSMELELRRRGFAHAVVDFHLEPSDAAPERVVFVVKEGPLGRIGAVTFPGCEAFEARELMQFLPTGSEPRFLQSQVDGAVDEIERTYLLEGYRDVRAGPAEVTWNEDKTRADIVIPITEGPFFTIESYTVEGELTPALEQTILLPLHGIGYYVRLPAEAAARIRAALRNRGHQKAIVEVKTTIEAAQAHLVFRVEPGPVYRVRNVSFTGQDRTRERFIRSRIPIKPGEVVDESEIAKGTDGLYRTGVFRSVDVSRSYPSDPDADLDADPDADLDADIEYTLEELDARSISFQVGWGSYELLRGGVRFQDRNFLGYGRRLDVEATASTKGYGLTGSISDNYILGPKNTLRFTAGIFEREEPSFTRRGYDFTASVTHELNRDWTITAGYSLDSQKATDIKTSLGALNPGEFLTSAGLFTNFVYDTRDSGLVPSKGSIGEAGVLWSAPALGADLNYLGLRLSWFSFFPVSEDFTIGTGFRFQSRPVLNDDPTLPIQKRLFLGGPTSVRSFGQSRLGPFDPLTNEPVGGLTTLSFHVEGRVRVWRELHLALFYEIGMVSRRSLTIQDPFGQAIGTGLRYYLPIGPIRIDAAYNPGETFSNARRWEFHFAFGFSF
jgi:outer membrane protein insertion porin family